MRVLVTGATGFLGHHLVETLVGRGAEVLALALEPGSLPDGVEFLSADVCDRAALERTVAAARPDAVAHLAALSHVGASWARIPEYFDVNVLGTENVVAAAAGRRLVFVSSAEVYGAVPEGEQPIAEDRAPAPRSPYALTKAAAERTALAAGGIVVRCFNLVGRGQLPSFALPGFAAQLAAIARGTAEPVLRVGNLSARRDFVPVEDAAEAFALVLERAEAGSVCNLATGTAISIADGLERLRRIAGVEATVVEDPSRLRPVDVPLLAGDAGTLRRLGWAPRRTLEQALGELWAEALERAEAA